MAEDIGGAASELGFQTDALKASLADLSRLGEGFGRTLVRSFASAIIEGRKLSDVLRSLALSLANQALSAALRPLGNLVGSLFSSAQGNVVSGGRILPFAEGGVVNSPVLFPLRGGAGMMGEAGPEAILPLARSADGKLGVRGGGRSVNVTVNIAASDVESFRQSQSQIAALITRAAERGTRNL